jgi:hypothetical protein
VILSSQRSGASAVHVTRRHKTRVLSPRICYSLTPGNSRVAFPRFQGGFVSLMRVALYARVSIQDQPPPAIPLDAMCTGETAAAAATRLDIGRGSKSAGWARATRPAAPGLAGQVPRCASVLRVTSLPTRARVLTVCQETKEGLQALWDDNATCAIKGR